MKVKGSKNKKGVKRILTIFGYYDVFRPEHSIAKKNGYIREHRMIAWDAGILTDPLMEVHHINGIKTDNRIENLMALPKAKHTSITHLGRKRPQHGSKPCFMCPTLTNSKYGLCTKHYKLEWQRGNLLK